MDECGDLRAASASPSVPSIFPDPIRLEQTASQAAFSLSPGGESPSPCLGISAIGRDGRHGGGPFARLMRRWKSELLAADEARVTAGDERKRTFFVSDLIYAEYQADTKV